MGYLSASATFASNHGPNLTNVYTGPVTVMPGTGNGATVPGPIYIDIPFTTPFLYDPMVGDLCFEAALDSHQDLTQAQYESLHDTGTAQGLIEPDDGFVIQSIGSSANPERPSAFRT